MLSVIAAMMLSAGPSVDSDASPPPAPLPAPTPPPAPPLTAPPLEAPPPVPAPEPPRAHAPPRRAPTLGATGESIYAQRSTGWLIVEREQLNSRLPSLIPQFSVLIGALFGVAVGSIGGVIDNQSSAAPWVVAAVICGAIAVVSSIVTYYGFRERTEVQAKIDDVNRELQARPTPQEGDPEAPPSSRPPSTGEAPPPGASLPPAYFKLLVARF
jgi:hypothetical protein